MTFFTKNFYLFIAGVLSFGLISTANGFSDIKIQDWQYEATEYLSESKVINGYKDGTFKPNENVNRAAALKMILAATEKKLSTDITIDFTDVDSGSWFEPYVKYAVSAGIVSGDAGKKSFAPGREVNKAEFIKMLLKAFDVDPTQYDLKDVEVKDVSTNDWFAPYMKFAIKFNIIKKDKDGNISPSKPLNRGEVAQMIFNILKSGQGLDAQVLLNIVEKKLITAIEALETEDLFTASSNVSVAHNFAKLTLSFLPNNSVVQASEKTASAVKNLVGAYTAGKNGLLDDIITASKKAWADADESVKLNPAQATIATEIKKFAESLANKARTAKEN